VNREQRRAAGQRGRPPTTLADRMRDLASRPGGGTFTEAHEPSFWLRTRLADLRTRHLTGQFTACPHLRVGVRGGRPMIIFQRAPHR